MITCSPDVFTGSYLTPPYSPGTQAQDDYGFTYTLYLVSASSANAGSAGRAFFHTPTTNTVSDDYTGGDGLSNSPAGICMGTVAKSSYGWFMDYGDYALCLCKSGAIAANGVVVGSTTDGKLVAQATTYTGALAAGAFGVARVAKASNGVATVSCHINIRRAS